MVFGEQARGGAFLLGGIVGAVLVGAGTILLARSPLLDPDTSNGDDCSEGAVSVPGPGGQGPGTAAPS